MSSTLRALIVDDEELLGRALAKAFRLDGWDAALDTGGEPALKRLASGEKFHAVVVDYLMPDVHGSEVLRWLKENQPKTVRILMTGQLDFAKDASQLAHAILQKPFQDILEVPKTARPFLPCE